MALFTEDSDEDSVATDTTAESEHSPGAGFNVEQILAEAVDFNDDMTRYLVKWEGYPLDRATWEPRDVFESEKPFRLWEKTKREAAEGGKELFDVEEYNDAVEKAVDEKEDRARRRAVKRRKRGEVVSSRSQSPARPVSRGTSAKLSATPAVKKKGVAQKLVRPTAQSTAKATASAAPAATAKPATSAPPMAGLLKTTGPARKTATGGSPATPAPAEPPKRKARPRVSGETPKDSQAPTFRTLSEQNRFQSYSRNEPAPDINALDLIDPSTGMRIPKPSTAVAATPSAGSVGGGGESGTTAPTANMTSERRRSEPQAARETAALPTRPTIPTIARPSGTAASTTASATNSFAAKSKPDQGARPAAPTDLNATGPSSFTATAATTTCAPKSVNDMRTTSTARPTPSNPGLPPNPPPLQTTYSSAHTSDIHSAYGRRSPPQERRQRSPSPPPPPDAPTPTVADPLANLSNKLRVCRDWETGNCRYTADTCAFSHTYKIKREVCHWWRVGNKCRYTAEQCPWAHWETGYSGLPLTCFFWKNFGACSRTEDQCRFAHHDTGQVAPPPRGWKPPPGFTPATSANALASNNASVVATGAAASNTPTVPITVAAPETASRVFEDDLPPVSEPVPMADVAMTDARPTPNNFQDKNNPDMDVDGVNVAQSSDDNSDDAWEAHLKKIDEYWERPERITDELELAKRSLATLDINPLLMIKAKGLPIENVYVSMPNERDEERQLLVDLFEGLKCKVFNSSNPRHWDLVKYHAIECEIPVLVVITPFEPFRNTMPGLARLLQYNKGWVFSIGAFMDWDHLVGPKAFPRLSYRAERVFPYGGVTFISDDVFQYYPDRATAIIKAFDEKARTKPPGGEHSRVMTRPGVRAWLQRLCRQKIAELDKEAEPWVNCAVALDEFCGLADYDPEFMGHDNDAELRPKKDALLWSEPEYNAPQYPAMWDADEVQATAYMAEFFAGVACTRKESFQRWWFVWQRPDQERIIEEQKARLAGAPDGRPKVEAVDPCGWMWRYCHIDVISTETWMARFKKRSG